MTKIAAETYQISGKDHNNRYQLGKFNSIRDIRITGTEDLPSINMKNFFTQFDTTVYCSWSRKDFVKLLYEACDWLNVSQGRAIEYIKALQDIETQEKLSNTQLFAHYESMDLIDLYLYWRDIQDVEKEIKPRLARIFRKGKLLSDEELDGKSTDRSRSEAFVFWLAGRLLKMGLGILQVDGIPKCVKHVGSIPDISLLWEEELVNVECKRIRSHSTCRERVEDAIDQIGKKKTVGIIALDCAQLIRERDYVVERDKKEIASGWAFSFLRREIFNNEVVPVLRKSEYKGYITGVILHSAYPVLTHKRVEQNNEVFRRDTDRSVVSIGSPFCASSTQLMLNIHNGFILTRAC